jgi:Cdc6-like AAA superfamily ATPase
VLIAKVQSSSVRVAMVGPKARVTVHCSLMHQGKISFRDLTRNLSILVSNAMPQKLLEFQQSLKRALNAPKTPPKWKPASPTSPWSRAQKRRLAPLSPSAQNKRFRDTPATTAKLGGTGSENAIRLSPQQQAVVELAEEGTSFFLTGGAGTGKSVVLREIIRQLPSGITPPKRKQTK